MKDMLGITVLAICFYGLSILPASANFSNPSGGWENSPIETNDGAVFKSPCGEKTIWDQEGGIKPFGTEDSPMLRAKPGTGTGQKEVSINDGTWLILGLAIAYGVINRKRRRTDDVDC